MSRTPNLGLPERVHGHVQVLRQVDRLTKIVDDMAGNGGGGGDMSAYMRKDQENTTSEAILSPSMAGNFMFAYGQGVSPEDFYGRGVNAIPCAEFGLHTFPGDHLAAYIKLVSSDPDAPLAREIALGIRFNSDDKAEMYVTDEGATMDEEGDIRGSAWEVSLLAEINALKQRLANLESNQG